MILNVKEEYGQKLEALLKKYKDRGEPLAKKGFYLYNEREKQRTLFIGMNPSDEVRGYGLVCTNGIYWYSGPKHKIPYYNRLFDLVPEGLESFDLFFTIGTAQKILEKEIKQKNAFLTEQFAISTEIIPKLEPKMVIVCNAYASRLLKEAFLPVFDDAIGTYRIKKWNNVPVFFSGMLSGQGQVDIGSRERLKWHIGFVEKKGY